MTLTWHHFNVVITNTSSPLPHSTLSLTVTCRKPQKMCTTRWLAKLDWQSGVWPDITARNGISILLNEFQYKGITGSEMELMGKLAHWGLNEMADILHMTFLNTFSWMKAFVYWLHLWSLFQGINWQLVSICWGNGIHMLSPGFNELIIILQMNSHHQQ